MWGDAVLPLRGNLHPNPNTIPNANAKGDAVLPLGGNFNRNPNSEGDVVLPLGGAPLALALTLNCREVRRRQGG